MPPEQRPSTDGLTAPDVPEDEGVVAPTVGEAAADVGATVAEVSVEEAAVVGMISMEIGVVLGETTGAGADDALTAGEYGALATGELELSSLELPAGADDEPASEPDEATPLTGPQVPVKVPDSEDLRVTSASGPGFG